MATNTIKFIQLSQAKYQQLASASSVSSSTIYFTSDTKRIYKGNDFYSNNISVNSFIPTAENAIQNVLYIDSTNGAMAIKYNNDMLILSVAEQLSKIASDASNYTDNSISDLHDTVSSQIAGALSSANSYTDSKLQGLGNVFELKGYADNNDHTKTPWTVANIQVQLGDVYLVDQTDSQNITRTVQYVCVSEPGDNESVSSTNFQRMGVSSSANEYVTFNYVEQKYSQNSASISTFKDGLKVLNSTDKIATFKADGYVQSSGKLAGADNSDLTGDNTLAAEKAVKSYVDQGMSQASAYVNNSVSGATSALSAYVDASIVWNIIED